MLRAAFALLVLAATSGCGDTAAPSPSAGGGAPNQANGGAAAASTSGKAGGAGGATSVGAPLTASGGIATSGGEPATTSAGTGALTNGAAANGADAGGRGATNGTTGAPGTSGTAGHDASASGANGNYGGTGAAPSLAGAAGFGSGGVTGQSSGGRAGAAHASGGADAGPYPELRFAGLVSALELAPLRLATNGPYPGKVTIASGGVDALCGSNPSADIATNAETQFLRASGGSGCEKVRIVFTLCEGLYRIVAKKSAGIASLADLAGKRVMAPSGASSAYYLTRMLSAAGLGSGSGAAQVNVVSGNPNGSTFTDSSAPDAATIWEPGIEQAAEALGTDAIVFEHDANDREVYRELFNLHTTTDVLADPAKRRAVTELVRNLIAASATLRADPTAANSLLTGPAGVSAGVLTQSMKYERFAGTLVSDLLDVLAEEEPWRASLDDRSPRSRDELAKYIDTSVLAEALAGGT